MMDSKVGKTKQLNLSGSYSPTVLFPVPIFLLYSLRLCQKMYIIHTLREKATPMKWTGPAGNRELMKLSQELYSILGIIFPTLYRGPSIYEMVVIQKS